MSVPSGGWQGRGVVGRVRTVPVAAALAVLIGTGLARRRLSDDAGTARALVRAAQELPGRLPASAGAWSGQVTDVDRRGLDRAGIAGLVARRYQNTFTGDEVTAVLVCGPPGPIAAHGPEACYRGLGFAVDSATVRVRVPGSGAEFWSAGFRGDTPAGPRTLRILWAWRGRGGWSAPDHPRLQFASAGVLDKLYLIHETVGGSDSGGGAALDLAAVLLAPTGPGRGVGSP